MRKSFDMTNKLSKEDKLFLEEVYKQKQRPIEEERYQLSLKFGVNISKITNWFQNRRAKEKIPSYARDREWNPFIEAVHPQCNSLYLRRTFL